MRKVAVVGIGHSRFGSRDDVNLAELGFEAIKGALQDADLTQKDIPFVAIGTFGHWSEELLPGIVVADYAGLNPAGLMRCEAACATGSAAARLAYLTVASGMEDIAMAVGVEKMTEVDTPSAVELIGRAANYFWEFENFGVTFPGYYAMHATAHMVRFGTKEEHLAMVAVKNHRYGALNPYAHFQREITVEEALRSRIIAWPLRLYDCCPISDGAAAVIFASGEEAKEITDTLVWVKGMGVASDTANMNKRETYVGLKATATAAKQAYKMAGIGPADVDVAVVHDCFTIAEILAYEDLGFCEKGKGAKLIQEEETYIGGKIPVNVDGGLKAKGHPIGATGCSMFAEITRQLRGDAGKRQVPLKKGIGLIHNVGGTGHYCYVSILGR